MTIIQRLRGTADLFEESPLGWALAQANLPQLLRQTADELEGSATLSLEDAKALVARNRELTDQLSDRIDAFLEAQELQRRQVAALLTWVRQQQAAMEKQVNLASDTGQDALADQYAEGHEAFRRVLAEAARLGLE